MHSHSQLGALQDLAHDYPDKSLQDVLVIALDNNIFPVIAAGRNWLVVATSWSQLKSQKKPPSPLSPRTQALRIDDVKCLEIDRSDCMRLLKDGRAIVRNFDAVHVLPKNSNDLSRKTARDFVKENTDIPKQIPIPILLPCFIAFEGPAGKSNVDVARDIQDLDPIPSVVRISDLRFALEDERVLIRLLGMKSTDFQIPNASGPHISPQFDQLLQVVKERHCEHRADPSINRKKSLQDIEQDLHQRLLDKDKDFWQSLTLRQCAIRLIYPGSSAGGRSKKMARYEAISSNLAQFLLTLKTRHEEIRNFNHAQHVTFLFQELAISQTDAKRITTIIRMEQSARGGRRQPKTQPESPAD